MPTPVTITEITPGSTGWQAVDLTAYFGSDAGNVAGVILEFVANTTSAYDIGCRKYGSTDTFTSNLLANAHIMAMCGVDSSDRIEINVGNTTNVDVYLIAYYLNNEAVFFDNWIDKSLGSNSVWTDIDISGNTGSDTAIAAIFFTKNVSSTTSYLFGFRNNGSSVTNPTNARLLALKGNFTIIGLTSEVCEHMVDNGNIDSYLVGYLTDKYVPVDYTDKQTGTAGSYQDTDVSAILSSTANGVYVHFDPITVTSSYGWDVRKNGSSRQPAGSRLGQRDMGTAWCEVDANKIFDQYVSNTAMDCYITGYSEPSSSVGTPTRKRRMNQPMRFNNFGFN